MNISQTLSKVPNYTSFYTVDELAAEGITIIDTPEGPKWKRA